MSNPDNKEILDANPANSQEEKKPLFGGVDSQGKERLFNDVEDVKQSWQNAQNFIKENVSETQSLRDKVAALEAELNQSTKLDDALAQFRNKEQSEVTDNIVKETTTETTPQLDVEQLKTQLTQEILENLSSSKRKEVEDVNENESISAAKAVLGDSFEDSLRERAASLGMSDNDILAEARTNPTKFKTLFGLDKQPKGNISPSSSYRGKPNEQAVEINLSGFNQAERVTNTRNSLAAKAKQMGIDPSIFTN